MILSASRTFPQLQTKRLVLRKVRPPDVDEYQKILACPELSTWSDLPIKPDRRRCDKFMKWMSNLHKRNTGCAWILQNRVSAQLVGAVRINSIQRKIQCGFIAYELHPGSWHQGFASEAVAAVVEFAHGTLELNRLEAWTVPGNDASDRVLLRNGFVLEGVHRDKLFLHNQLFDQKTYARLRNDPLPAMNRGN